MFYTNISVPMSFSMKKVYYVFSNDWSCCTFESDFVSAKIVTEWALWSSIVHYQAKTPKNRNEA